MMDKTDTMMKVGSYETYSVDKISRVETGDVVLFFHASWCPSCRGLNSSIENNLKSIPEGVTILKTDYDKETELKKKYGVTYQHTLVQVDKDGNMIKKWSGGGSLDNLLSQIQ
jgi:thiol-disulfide isomerase/thioredoxin